MKIRRIAAVVLALTLALCLTAAASADAIKLAVIGPMTGPAGDYGRSVRDGAQLAADEINAAAGEEVVTLIISDDEHDAEKAKNAYNNAMENGAQAIVGTVTTAPCKEVSAIANEERVFLLTPSASSPDVIANKNNTYQLCFSDTNQGSASAQYIAENKLATKVGIIYNNADSYSTGIYQSFMDTAATLGLEVCAEAATFTDDTTDFSVQVSKMQEQGADLVFMPIYYTPASMILRTAHDIGYAPIFFGVDGMDGILSLENFDVSLAEGVYLLTPFAADATDDLTVNFVANYKAAYGSTPSQFAADGYDCVYAMVAAFKAAGLDASTSPEDACEALISTFSGGFTFSGLTGENMTWDASGAVSKSPRAVIIKNGVYVSPENY